MKILILKSSSLGDVVQALPVLRLLKLHLPSSEIYWWLSAELLPLLKDDPDLQGIFPFERKRWASLQNWDELFLSLRQMRQHAFDWVIDLQGLARSGLISWLARGKLTIGLDDSREGAVAFYDVLVPRPSFFTHAVDWYLGVLPLLHVPVHRNFTWLPDRKPVTVAMEQKWQWRGKRWVILSPGGRWLNKRWSVECYAKLTRLLLEAYPDVHIALLGSRSEAELGAAITREDPKRCLNLIGQTSLPEMVEWIRLSELMITNDTGPMHVAAALDRPVVAIFGPTEPHRTGPYRQVDRAIRVSLPCAPCMKSRCTNEIDLECLRSIPTERVFAEVQRRLIP